MMFALLAACASPCVDRPRFADPHDLAPEGMLETIEARWDEWIGWTNVADLCVSTVQVADVQDGVGALTQDDSRITVDPEALDPERILQGQLCRALYRERGYSWAPPHLFADEDAFAAACEVQPESLGYFAIGDSVCGHELASNTDRFFEELFVDYSPRDDGQLAAVLGEPREIALPTDGLWHTVQWVPVGQRIAVLRVTDLHAVIEWVDLDQASGMRGLELDVSGYDVLRLFGGLERGALWWETPDFTTSLVALEPDLEPTAVDVADPGWAYDGVVSEGTFYATGGVLGTIEAYRLDDGSRIDPALPAIVSAAPEIVAGALHASPGGVLAELYEAEIEQTEDTVNVGVYRAPLDRYDGASDTWTELTEQPQFDGSALAPSGVMAGPTFGAYPLLAAYDSGADRFLVSDDLCLDGVGDIEFVGDRWWRIAVADEVVIAEPIDLSW